MLAAIFSTSMSTRNSAESISGPSPDRISSKVSKKILLGHDLDFLAQKARVR